MKKFEITYEEKNPTGEEIERHQDFDGLMERHDTMLYHRRLRKRILITASLIILPGLFVFGYLKRDWIPFIQKAPVPEQIAEVEAPMVQEEAVEEPEVIVMTEPLEKAAPSPAPEKEVGKEKSGVDNLKVLKDQVIQARPADGYEELYKYFEEAIEYPKASLDKRISGPVRVRLWINVQGRPEKIRIIEGINDELNAEAIRVIKNMPSWRPAIINGQYYPSQLALTVMFIIKPEMLSS